MGYTADDIATMIANFDAGKQAEQQAPETPAAEPEVTDPVVEGTPEVTEVQHEDKDAAAFAEMRTTNKIYGDLLKKVADGIGLQYSNTDEMIAALNSDALNKIAEKKGIPVEFLQRMETLEANSRRWEEQQTQQRLTAGFGALQQKYGLDQGAMLQFAQQLDNEHVNLATLDVEKEYISRNFETIVQSRINTAVQEALAKVGQVQQQSTTPAAPGANLGNSEPTKITKAADLISLLGTMPGGYK